MLNSRILFERSGEPLRTLGLHEKREVPLGGGEILTLGLVLPMLTGHMLFPDPLVSNNPSSLEVDPTSECDSQRKWLSGVGIFSDVGLVLGLRLGEKL